MTMNGAPVSESDMPAVQERCDQLSNADATQSLTDTTSDAADTASDANDSNASNDAVLENAPATNQVENATTKIDLDTISLQACIDGGFVTQ
jgi:RNA polymerase-binding transcription factor DksA